MGRTRRVSGRAIVLVVVALAAAACSGGGSGGDGGAGTVDAAGSSDGPTIVATTSILGDVVRSIAGDAAQVEVLIPAGIDPHGFSPSARDADRLRTADLVVANGLGLEESLLDALDAAEEDGVAILHVAEHVEPLSGDADDGHADDEHADDEHAEDEHAEDEHTDEEHADEEDGDHGHGPLDPHVWLDPVRMAEVAEVIAARIAEVDADGLTADEWAERGRAYAEELRELDREIAGLLEPVPDERRLLVSSHDNLRYFADRYGFEVIGTVVPGTSSQAQPSTREVSDLAALIEELDVPAIFTDVASGSDRLAEALAAEVGRDVAVVPVYTDALGEDGSGAETLVGMLRTNARRIADALG